MNRVRVPVAGLGVAALLLTGCATDAGGSARAAVADITEDANSGDADAVRRGVQELVESLNDAVRSGDLTGAQADPIIAAALAVQERAVLLEEQVPEPTMEPEPEPETTEEPEPTAEPEPEPTEEPDEDKDGDKGDADEQEKDKEEREAERAREQEERDREQAEREQEQDDADDAVPTVPVPVSPS